jgi:cytoskeletal protein CcmA (bactofilin family)
LGKTNINKKIFGKIETLISQDTKVDGVIEAVGTLRIDGTVSGGISKADGVIIGTTGIVEGDINAEGVSLAGKVVGNIYAAVNLELMPGSTLKGDIHTSQLSISEGAHFDGVCSMIDEKTTDNTSFNETRKLGESPEEATS